MTRKTLKVHTSCNSWRRRVRFACALLPLLAATCLSSYAAPVNLDFGPDSAAVKDGYDKATASTLFDGKFGWTEQYLIEERDRGGEDPLTRDFLFGTRSATFRIALPDGAYRVTLICGDRATSHPSFAVRAGDSQAFEVPAVSEGQFAEVAFDIGVKHDSLDITFLPLTDKWLVNGMTVKPLPADPPLYVPKFRLSGTTQWRPAVRLDAEPPGIKKLRLVKKTRRDGPTYPDVGDYMRVLERFPLFAERGWHPSHNGLTDVGYFGDGTHGEMGLRSMGNFIFTCALLSSDPAYDSRPTGVSREKLLDYARQCLRYMTRTHVTGDLTCADGGKWGDAWQSAWWTGKMAVGARLIWDRLTDEERAAVERVVVHEADRHLERAAPSGVWSNTRSEETAWDTEALAAAFALFPEHPHAPRWWRKLQDFSMNTLSAPQDQWDFALVDYRQVNRWVYTETVHADFTIENHGAYHSCYMACPLHSIAWDWYALTSARRPVPRALFHHYTDVWSVLRRMILYDGRFAYVSGKDWPRYAYGLSFIMPALVMLQYEFGDRDARLFEKNRFQILEWEQVLNSDGTFYGRRFTANHMLDRQLEFETDTYANLGVCYLMHETSTQTGKACPYIAPSDPDDFQRRMAGTFMSKDCEFTVGRSPKVFTSFSWRELGGKYPIGLFIPAGCDDMAEWGREQLAGSFDIEGSSPKSRELKHNEEAFDGGFWTVGSVTRMKDDTPLLRQDLAFISFPEEGIALLIDRAVAVSDITVRSHEGLKFYLANDVFNDGLRRVRSPAGEIVLWGGEKTMRTPSGGKAHALDVPWLSVDEKLSFVRLSPDAPFTLRDIRGRTASYNSIEYEMISLPYAPEPRKYKAGETVRDSAIILAAGGRRLADDLSRHSRILALDDPDSRPLLISSDGKKAWRVRVDFRDLRAIIEPQIPRTK